MRRLFLTIAVALWLSPQAYSQRSINYRLTLFGSGEMANKSYANVPEGSTLVKAIRGYVADPTKASLRDERYLDFFEASRKQEGEEPMKPDFTITVPSDAGSDLLILLVVDGKKLTPKFLDFKKLKVGKGDQMFFNTLPVPVALMYSDGTGDKWGSPVKIGARSQSRIPGPSEPAVGRRVAALNAKTKKYVIFSKGVYLKPSIGREVTFCYLGKGDQVPSLETILIHDVKGNKPAGG